MPAAGALQQRCPHRPRFVVPASRTTKTLRPAELTQILSTGLLGGETRLELGQIPRIIFHFPDPTSCGHLSQVNTHPRRNRVRAGVPRVGHSPVSMKRRNSCHLRENWWRRRGGLDSRPRSFRPVRAWFRLIPNPGFRLRLHAGAIFLPSLRGYRVTQVWRKARLDLRYGGATCLTPAGNFHVSLWPEGHGVLCYASVVGTRVPFRFTWDYYPCPQRGLRPSRPRTRTLSLCRV